MAIIYRKTQYRTRCQFSKELIEKNTYIIQFNRNQYNYFVENIKRLFFNLPDDIIDLIIKKTNYENYINHWGLVEYVNWSPKLLESIDIPNDYDCEDESDDDIRFDYYGQFNNYDSINENYINIIYDYYCDFKNDY
tara:strand:- start:2479 stop:2886 length:408 start_codon:yes stop_codon:yes gene_type:complete